MKRRELLKWSTPVIAAVVLPAHAQTSMEPIPVPLPEPEPIEPEVPDEPVPTPDPQPEFSDPEDCTVPFIEPGPGFSQQGMCRARGLKAAALDRRATALFNSTRPVPEGFPSNQERACEAIRNYKFCGFTEDPESRLCNALRRQVIRNGDLAVNIIGPSCN